MEILLHTEQSCVIKAERALKMLAIKLVMWFRTRCTGSYQKPKETRTDSPLRFWREEGPEDTLILFQCYSFLTAGL